MGRIKRDLAHDLEQSGQATVGKGFAMSIGRGSIGTTRFMSRLFAPTASEPYRRLARNVRRVQVAHYALDGAVDGRRVSRPASLDRYQADGWYPMVTVRDSSSAVWVLVKERPDDLRLTDLLSVVVADSDLVVTRVSGDLSGLVLDAIEYGTNGDLFGGALDQTGLFDEPDGPEAETDDPDVSP
ncbi:hypothetical protein [Rubrivirga sp.]|uniref:hypothetical protein n=1 Tax=Rubrivirga sp. TaxID=1885344 RepID=UPI003B521B5B